LYPKGIMSTVFNKINPYFLGLHAGFGGNVGKYIC
jgi:hypothetical protein